MCYVTMLVIREQPPRTVIGHLLYYYACILCPTDHGSTAISTHAHTWDYNFHIWLAMHTYNTRGIKQVHNIHNLASQRLYNIVYTKAQIIVVYHTSKLSIFIEGGRAPRVVYMYMQIHIAIVSYLHSSYIDRSRYYSQSNTLVWHNDSQMPIKLVFIDNVCVCAFKLVIIMMHFLQASMHVCTCTCTVFLQIRIISIRNFLNLEQDRSLLKPHPIMLQLCLKFVQLKLDLNIRKLFVVFSALCMTSTKNKPFSW